MALAAEPQLLNGHKEDNKSYGSTVIVALDKSEKLQLEAALIVTFWRTTNVRRTIQNYICFIILITGMYMTTYRVRVIVFNKFSTNFNYIVEVFFIGGGNRSTRRKTPTCRKSLTSFTT